MKRIVLAHVILMLVSIPAIAKKQGDACHVYALDVAKGRKALEQHGDAANPDADVRAIRAAQTMFPEFRTVIGEEELTTKSYRLPGTRLFITASVYYTDESMKSSHGQDSMLLGIVVSESAQKDAISADDNAVAEVTLNDRTDIVRVKRYVKASGRLYLVGLECRKE